MSKYPYIVYRLIPGFYSNTKIDIVATATESKNSHHELVWANGPIFDSKGCILSAARSGLRKIGLRQQKASKLRVCMVYADEDCDFFEPGGYIVTKSEPPCTTMHFGSSPKRLEFVTSSVEADAMRGSNETTQKSLL